MWRELSLTASVPFRENDTGHNDADKFQCINLEFVGVSLGENGPFVQAIRKRENADDFNCRDTHTNCLFGGVCGQFKSRVSCDNMTNELFPRQAFGQIRIDNANTTPRWRVDGDPPPIAPHKLCE